MLVSGLSVDVPFFAQSWLTLSWLLSVPVGTRRGGVLSFPLPLLKSRVAVKRCPFLFLHFCKSQTQELNKPGKGG